MKEPNIIEIMKEMVDEDVALMKEIIEEEIVPLIKYQKELERKIADKAIDEMYKAEEGL